MSSSQTNSPNPKLNNERKAFKLVFIGDGGAGKTSLISSFVNNSFPDSYVPTVFDNVQTEILHSNNKSSKQNVYRLDIHDLAGQEDYSRIRKLAYPDTDCFCLVIDITERATFENVHDWVKEIENYVPEDQRRMILIGNKIDKEDQRLFTVTDAREKAHHYGIKGYVECSAKTMVGVKELFDYAASIILDDNFELDYQKEFKKKKKDCIVM